MDCEVIYHTNSTNGTNIIIHNYFSNATLAKPKYVFN